MLKCFIMPEGHVEHKTMRAGGMPSKLCQVLLWTMQAGKHSIEWASLARGLDRVGHLARAGGSAGVSPAYRGNGPQDFALHRRIHVFSFFIWWVSLIVVDHILKVLITSLFHFAVCVWTPKNRSHPWWTSTCMVVGVISSALTVLCSQEPNYLPPHPWDDGGSRSRAPPLPLYFCVSLCPYSL